MLAGKQLTDEQNANNKIQNQGARRACVWSHANVYGRDADSLNRYGKGACGDWTDELDLQPNEN
jgi:hypothetical protein